MVARTRLALPSSSTVSAVGWDRDLDAEEKDLGEWEQYGPTRTYLLPGEPLAFLTAPPALRKIIEDDFAY